jgi:hypothetical protein
MKFEFPKIIREFPLSEYAPEVKGSIQVWVNPPVKTLDELAEAFNEYAKDNGQEKADVFLSVVSVLLSQADDVASRWTVDELKELYDGTKETDPAFWWWFHNRILQAIQEHRLQLKKV